ncbi:hypothetical protein C8F04DRAFT_1262237 [Mycena alexandri]|uniref:Uncharacterized protein n=1 Tax=Mycena alexandri TaxID=1745969 RepID=A0AAD6X0H8_9AGAR|nr:hypothetical protein C8F04DRAFT_1262237 [Mycena alexandri]
MAHWYLQALNHFVELAFLHTPEQTCLEWVAARLVDKRDLIDGKFLFPPPSIRLHDEDWSDPRAWSQAATEGLLLHQSKDAADFRFEGLQELFFLLAAVAETGTFHPFNPDTFDQAIEAFPFEPAAFIAEGITLSVFLQELANELPQGSYSPEDRFLFHRVDPPPVCSSPVLLTPDIDPTSSQSESGSDFSSSGSLPPKRLRVSNPTGTARPLPDHELSVPPTCPRADHVPPSGPRTEQESSGKPPPSSMLW